MRINIYAQDPQVGIAMGFLLQIRMSWLRALSKGCRCWCWCCGPGRWCCELAERAFKTGGGAGRVLVSADCARCRKLAAQAACILVPASRMSTGRGILPSYLGLCWCNSMFFQLSVNLFRAALHQIGHRRLWRLLVHVDAIPCGAHQFSVLLGSKACLMRRLPTICIPPR